MDVIQLKSFYEVAMQGNLSKAAEKLCITQPALSRQIESLEKSIGMDLFTRHSRGVRLTEAGRRLFAYAERIIKLTDEATQSLKDMQNLDAGQISLCACTTAGNYLLPQVIASFHKLHPGIDINLDIYNSNIVNEMVLNGSHNLYFTSNLPNFSGICIEPLFEDELILIASSSHALSSVHNPSIEDLSKQTWILREQGSGTKHTVEQLISKNNIKPTRIISLGSVEAAKSAVLSNMGVTILSRLAVKSEIERGIVTVFKLPNLCLKRPLVTIYPKNTRLSPANLAFLSHLKKSLN